MVQDYSGKAGLFKAGGVGALAAALAALATPSAAIAQNHSWQHDRQSQRNSASGENANHGAWQQRVQQRAAPQATAPNRGYASATMEPQANRSEPRQQQVPNWRDQRRDTMQVQQQRNHSWDRYRNQQVQQRDNQRWDQNRGQRVEQRDQRDWDRNRAQQMEQRDNRRWEQRGDRRVDSRDYRTWNRSWRNDNRYDWQRYRARNRDIYRMGRYYAPYRDYSYRRVGIGFYLGSLFYGSNYWIADPWEYRLPAVYGPYRWVRYYDDALLVNVYTGQVVDVIYDFFW